MNSGSSRLLSRLVQRCSASHGVAVHSPRFLPASFCVRAASIHAAQCKKIDSVYEGPNRVILPTSREMMHEKRTRRENMAERSEEQVQATSTVSELTKARLYAEALTEFRKVANPDSVLRNAALNACTKALWWDEAQEIWKNLEEKNVVSYTTLIDLCGKMKKPNEAQQLFDEMGSNDIAPNIITFGALIHAYSMSLMQDRAVAVFESIPKQLLQDASVVSKQSMYLAVMSATARMGDYAKTREFFVEMTQAGISPNHLHFNAMISSCARIGDAQTGKAIFDMLPHYNLKPRCEDYTILISCCRQDLSLCIEVWNLMEKNFIRPTRTTNQEMLKAYVNAGDRKGAQALIEKAGEGLDRNNYRVQGLISRVESLPEPVSE